VGRSPVRSFTGVSFAPVPFNYWAQVKCAGAKPTTRVNELTP
jgi:hypothetical protein